MQSKKAQKLKRFTYSYPISFQLIRNFFILTLTSPLGKLSDTTLAEVSAVSNYRMDNLQKSAT